jgi:hypothetical protein
MDKAPSYKLSPQAAVKAMAKDPEWTMKAGIGGLFYAIAFVTLLLNPLLFPLSICLIALIQGYFVTMVHRTASETEEKLPEWKGWSELLIAGLTWMAISSVRIFVEVVFVLSALIIASQFAPDSVLSHRFAPWAITIWTFLVLFLAATSFFSTYLFASFSTQQDTKAAFALREISRRLAKHPAEMVKGWLLSTGIFCIGVVAPLITVVGAFLVPSTTFIAQIISAQILAQVWRNTRLD